MIKFFRLICFCFFLLGNCYADTSDNDKYFLKNLTCNQLMHRLIKDNAFNRKFQDKNLAVDLYYERQDDRYIGLTYACKEEMSDCDFIYANFELDLMSYTLKYLDLSHPILIKINKYYIPYIADKCTPEENLYRRGKLPDPEES